MPSPDVSRLRGELVDLARIVTNLVIRIDKLEKRAGTKKKAKK